MGKRTFKVPFSSSSSACLSFVAIIIFTQCVVPENIHTPTTERIGNSEGVGEEGQSPRKFQRGGGLNDRVGFQMPFDS